MKIAVGISGGVDSAVAALLLKEQGHEVVGVTMTLGRENEAQSLAEAKAAADRLGIPLKVFDFAAEWQTQVVEYLKRTYLGGQTPNPCVRCNETVKFGLLPQAAFALGCERFATGHYARIAFDDNVRLLRAVDRTKDQSYFLYRARPEILARTIFPLGELTKAEVREKARAFGLEVADKGDSQDFCGGDPMKIVGAAPRVGNIVTADGKVLGRHQGFWNYTIGKRKGLGIGGGTPYYVIGLDAVRNEVVVGFRESVVVHQFKVDRVVFLTSGKDSASPFASDRNAAFNKETKNGEAESFPLVRKELRGPLSVKVRSAGEPHGPVAFDGETVHCPDGITGVAPGQSAVFYCGDEVVGGGVIASALAGLRPPLLSVRRK